MKINDIIKKSESDQMPYLLTKFLTPEEVEDLKHQRLINKNVSSYGGYPDAERKRVIISDLREDITPSDFKIVTLKITLPKKDPSITHRNILGYIMSLGVKREVLGDIIIQDNCYYLMVTEDIVNFMMSNITRINQYLVTPEIVDFKDTHYQITKEEKEIMISSNRLDAIIAKTYNLSRETAQELIDHSCVQINHHQELKLEKTLNLNDLVSVRGYGKFTYLGEIRHTKKDKMVVLVSIYK